MRGVKKLQNWMILAKIKTPWIKSLKMAKKGNHSHYVDMIAINTKIIILYSGFFLKCLKGRLCNHEHFNCINHVATYT